MYFDDGCSMYVAPVFFIQVDTMVKVLESRFFTQYKSKGFGGISNWIQEVIYVLYMSSDMYKVDI